MASREVLDLLGLVMNDEPREVALESGVVLVMRPPEAKDWVAARAAMAEVTQADKILTAAGKRYDWSGKDKLALVNPDTWERIARWCLLVELATLVVSEVYRDEGGERRSVEPTVETFRFLLKLGDNFDRFEAEVRKAERELIQPKKG